MPKPRIYNDARMLSPMAPRPPVDATAERADDAWAASMAREIPASRLSPGQKNQVWREIKASDPQRQAFLQDAGVQKLMKTLGAEPTFPPELVQRASANQHKVTKP